MVCRFLKLFVCFCALGAAGCSSQQSATARPMHDAAWLQAQLSELETLPCPEGCAAADWAQLKAGLSSAIEARLAGRQAADVPTDELARPKAQLDPDRGNLFWYFVSPGDYDQNGEVNISDLTPLGASLNQQVKYGFLGFTQAPSPVDGDSNGLVTIADLTPLGARLGDSITEWHLYESTDINDYPTEATAPSTISPILITPVQPTTFGPPERRRYFAEGVVIDPAKWYWVRAFDGLSEGVPSNVVGGGNQAPTLSVTASILDGTTPFVSELDASGTTDPESQPLEFYWGFEDTPAENYFFSDYGPQVNHIFTTEGIFRVIVYVIDSMGGIDIETLYATSSAGAKWRIYEPAPDEQLGVGDNVELIRLTNGEPAIAYTDGAVGDRYVQYLRSGHVEGKFWGLPEAIHHSSNSLTDMDMALVDGAPGLCWVEAFGGNETLRCALSGSSEGSLWTVNDVTTAVSIDAPSITSSEQDVLIVFRGVNALRSAEGLPWSLDPWVIGDIAGFGNDIASAALIGGSPAVVYSDSSTPALQFADSLINPGGEAIFSSPVVAKTLVTPAALSDSLTELVDGSPSFAYNDRDLDVIRFVRAQDNTGDNWLPAQDVATVPALLAGDPAMALVSSRPLLVYRDETELIAAWATDAGGTNWTQSTIATSVTAVVDPDVAEIAGKPAVVFVGSDLELRYAIFY
jgi:hypothetical protein